MRESRIKDRPAKADGDKSSLKINIELDLEVEVSGALFLWEFSSLCFVGRGSGRGAMAIFVRRFVLMCVSFCF